MPEVTLTKNLCIPFLATGGAGTTQSPYTWAQIDKSTIFALNANPQSETMDYICYESPVSVIDHYEPELPQEIVMNEGNPMYDFIFEKFYNLPVGAAAEVPLLVCFPTKSSTAADKKAWLVPNCSLELGEFNTVDRKITFTLKLGGDIKKGTYSIASGGAPTFTPAT